MLCPVCHKDAFIVEYHDIELDYCPLCRGVWFDAGELELLLESAGLEDYQRYLDNIIHSPEAETSEKKRKCPICNHKMKKTYIDRSNKIIIDVCGDGDGIWFDGGEVNHLVQELVEESPEKGASQDVVAFIGDMFKYRSE